MTTAGSRPQTAATEALEHLMAFGQLVRQLHAGRGGTASWMSLGLTMPQLKLLLAVVVSGGARSGSLADRLAIKPSAVTPLVDRLLALRLVRRDVDPDDRRIVWVKPTARARALHDQLIHAGRAVMTDILAEVPAAERPAVARALRRLVQAAERVAARTPKTSPTP